jgi:hypothetical protein
VPFREERMEPGAFPLMFFLYCIDFSLKTCASDRHTEGPWQRGVEQVQSPSSPSSVFHPPLGI